MNDIFLIVKIHYWLISFTVVACRRKHYASTCRACILLQRLGSAQTFLNPSLQPDDNLLQRKVELLMRTHGTVGMNLPKFVLDND